jgi:hypothetical protein
MRNGTDMSWAWGRWTVEAGRPGERRRWQDAILTAVDSQIQAVDPPVLAATREPDRPH